MIAKIVKIEKKSSKYGGFFFYAFLKTEDGKSYYTCLYPKMRNYKKWQPFMKVGITLKGLEVLKGRLINADSRISEVKNV